MVVGTARTAMPGMGPGKPKPLSRITFDKYDTDGDGKMNHEEFQRMCYDMGYFLEASEVETAIKMIDVSGNGTLEYDEFMKWWSTDNRFARLHMTPLQEERLSQIATEFQKFDKATKGFVDTMRDFPQMHKWLLSQNLTKKSLEHCKEALDGNMDGRISFNEYIRWLLDTGALVGVQAATN
ncbi:EF-hand [Gonapodya prolifera JEL478]|uniref:EF-hand n=1 Tax=Gonapodya prolifera (strain JEL478) TaxID=1344416 RepID=A0A139AFY7_GONPJ|nr:EF-hand [Gonapodya prolifera JEL478]|eukprot:KXS15474.1 EF-hand [Gonapodya prolifera JEL478]